VVLRSICRQRVLSSVSFSSLSLGLSESGINSCKSPLSPATPCSTEDAFTQTTLKRKKQSSAFSQSPAKDEGVMCSDVRYHLPLLYRMPCLWFLALWCFCQCAHRSPFMVYINSTLLLFTFRSKANAILPRKFSEVLLTEQLPFPIQPPAGPSGVDAVDG
jgi:hypothetical protein